jgi:hypothetical protein
MIIQGRLVDSLGSIRTVFQRCFRWWTPRADIKTAVFVSEHRQQSNRRMKSKEFSREERYLQVFEQIWLVKLHRSLDWYIYIWQSGSQYPEDHRIPPKFWMFPLNFLPFGAVFCGNPELGSFNTLIFWHVGGGYLGSMVIFLVVASQDLGLMHCLMFCLGTRIELNTQHTLWLWLT